MDKIKYSHTGHAGFKKAVIFSALSIGVSMLPLAQALALDGNTLPMGGTVTNGTASLDYSKPNELHINQSSDRVVIDWNSFNIGTESLTQFHQSGTKAIAVNRVIGSFEPTKILGSLKANGQIIILDQNGVIFGKNSTIDVGGILASTGNIDTAAFMSGSGKLEISDIDTGGSIINHGHITVAEAGLAAFVAPTVINNGIIEAKLGKVSLASGRKATIDLYGDGLFEVAADAPLQQALVENSGQIIADSGKIKMTAAAAQNVVNNVINVSGIVSVASVTQKGGKIILEGPSVKVSGKLDASGKTGGGTIHVGGEWQGGGTTRTAKAVTVSQDARIDVSTTGTDGDGGEAVIWSDKQTHFAGLIAATGGSLSGNGGRVETSAKGHLQIDKNAQVAVGANNTQGKGGEWLLDPEDIVISNTGNDGNPATSDVASSTINATLNGGGNVTISTNAGMSGNGDILLSSATILKSTSNNDATLTLNAHRDIVLNNSSIGNSSANKLNVVFNADRDGNQDGAIDIVNSSITTNRGYFVAGGGSGILFGTDGIEGTADDATSTGADKIAARGNSARGSGVRLSTSSVTTNGGNVYMAGQGWANSTGATVGTSAVGVRLDSSTISSAGGNVKVTGIGGGTGTSNYNMGIYILNNSNITSTAGHITAHGTAGGGSGSTIQGVSISSTGTNYVRTTTGNIDITGHAASTTGNAIGGSGRIDLIGAGSITLRSTQGILQTNNTVGHATLATGDITYISDQVDISGGSVRTTGKVNIKAASANRTINLGYTTGGLDLSATELGRITASALVIGDSALLNPENDIVVDSLDLSGRSFDVELYGNDITFQDTNPTSGIDYAINLGTGNFMAHAKDKDTATIDKASLSVNAAILKSQMGTSLLDLRSDRNIGFSSGHITATNGTLNVVLNADRDADQDGAISLSGSNIATNNGWLVAGGGSGRVWGTDGLKGNADDAISTGADNTAAWGNSDVLSGIHISNSLISTGTADMKITGQALLAGAADRNGIRLINANLSTTSGSIYATGTGGDNSSGGAAGLTMQGATSLIQTDTGTIRLKGTAGNGGSGTNNHGIFLSIGTVRSTGTGTGLGSIILEGTGNTGTSSGAFNLTRDMKILTQDADIQFIGSSINGGSRGIASHQGYLIESTGTGNIDINLGSGTLGTNSNGVDRIATHSGDIRIIAGGLTLHNYADVNSNGTLDAGDIETPDTISAGRNLYIQSTAPTINIGRTSGSGLILDDRTLSNISAGNSLIIGNSSLSSNDIIIDSWDLLGKSYNLELYGNDITLQDTDSTSGVDYALRRGSGSVLLRALNNVGDTNADITLDAAIVGTASSALTLLADNNIVLNAGIANAGSGETTLSAGGDGSGLIDINNNANIALGGALSMTATGGNIAIANSDLSSVGLTANSSIVYDGSSNVTRSLSAGNGTLSLGSVNASNRDLILTADDMVLNGAISTQSDRSVTLRTAAANRTINLGGGTGGLNINDAELGYFNTGLLRIGTTSDSNAINIDTWDLTNRNHHTILDGTDIDIGGLIVGNGNITAYASGDITISADSNSNAAGSINLLATGNVSINEDLINVGTGKIAAFAGWDGLSAVTTPALFTVDDIALSSTARDIILGTNGRVSSGGSGTSVLLVASDNFANNSTLTNSAIQANSGRYLIYSNHPDATSKGGLSAKNLYNRTWAAEKPSSLTGNSRFVFAYQPTITISADNITTSNPGSAVYSYSATSGLRSGDLLTDAVSGTASYSLGTLAGNTRPIVMGLGSLSSPMGYAITLADGTMTINSSLPPLPPPIPVTSPVAQAETTIRAVINHITNLPKASINYAEQLDIPDDITMISGISDIGYGAPLVNMGTNSNEKGDAKEIATHKAAASEQENSGNKCLVTCGVSGICVLH